MKINTLQRNGIIQLAVLIIAICFLFKLKEYLPTNKPQFTVNTKLQAQLNKQKKAFDSTNTKTPKTYYVNSITDFTGYQLGLSTPQIDHLLAYLNSEKLIYTLNQFQQITKVNPAQLDALKTKLRFPKKKNFNTKKTFYPKKETKSKTVSSKRFNINTITSKQLETEFKLPKFIADRIIKFRFSVNGFNNLNQIDKVYGLRDYQVKNIKQHCYLK